MNRENMQKLIDAFKTREAFQEVGFNMMFPSPNAVTREYPDHSGEGCGTAACVGGHAAILAGLEDIDDGADWLGLEEGDNFRLFYPQIENEDWDSIKPDHAVYVLEKMLEGERVCVALWEEALEKVEIEGEK